MKSAPIIHRLFRDYYANQGGQVKPPSAIQEREFGFISFDRVMVRHRAFSDDSGLRAFLREFVPSDAYYSSAYYTAPEANMEQKGWLGADLVFDIDADHIPTPCEKIHDEWTCGACRKTGKGVAPPTCPSCGKEKFETKTWPCEVCLETTKKETIKLLEMLEEDFGLGQQEIHVFFSGHRGYHVHVENEAVQTLDAIARKEIVDYLMGLGFDVPLHGLDDKALAFKPSSEAPLADDAGWNKRITRGIESFVRNPPGVDMKNIGLAEETIGKLTREKETILAHWSRVKAWDTVRGLGPETWRKIAQYIVKSSAAKIDTVVTTDIHRLIRLTDALHGKTGMKKVEFSPSAIDGFDPFKSSVAFKNGTLRVFVSDAPEFRIGNGMFGPFKNQTAELPTAAAVLLVCRDRAEVVG